MYRIFYILIFIFTTSFAQDLATFNKENLDNIFIKKKIDKDDVKKIRIRLGAAINSISRDSVEEQIGLQKLITAATIIKLSEPELSADLNVSNPWKRFMSIGPRAPALLLAELEILMSAKKITEPIKYISLVENYESIRGSSRQEDPSMFYLYLCGLYSNLQMADKFEKCLKTTRNLIKSISRLTQERIQRMELRFCLTNGLYNKAALIIKDLKDTNEVTNSSYLYQTLRISYLIETGKLTEGMSLVDKLIQLQSRTKNNAIRISKLYLTKAEVYAFQDKIKDAKKMLENVNQYEEKGRPNTDDIEYDDINHLALVHAIIELKQGNLSAAAELVDKTVPSLHNIPYSNLIYPKLISFLIKSKAGTNIKPQEENIFFTTSQAHNKNLNVSENLTLLTNIGYLLTKNDIKHDDIEEIKKIIATLRPSFSFISPLFPLLEQHIALLEAELNKNRQKSSDQ